ncbi:hypothetical protein BK816_05850 [Boudabousia tangfeifanii]|uniref:N-acetyltransferase domain-containing protein n=1 Tax=Boudabousia tangfeifanii TaxID=1912795 RepID=A0A1D9MKP0_9ACTO|nr:GNAT family N-acetyltransferase [Boudabousia tangfeifanii]AOZ72874.1 hypothetical protein BK816_05850 [Boudabousia tangfeifanii]
MSSKNAARLARPKDVEAIAELTREDLQARLTALGLSDFSQLPSEATIAGSWEAAMASPDGETLLVATADNQVVGYAAFSENDGDALVVSFYITQAEQRKGHGSRLLQAVVDHAKLNSQRLGVFISTNDSPRQRFFNSTGFAPTTAGRQGQIAQVTEKEKLWFTQISDN